jgi:phospholipid/cholesterol/gamma-HCH transport system permease protein
VEPLLRERIAGTTLAAPTGSLAGVGTMAQRMYQTVRCMIRPPFRVRQLIDAMEFIGVQSVFIVELTRTFAGAVFALWLVDALHVFNAENQPGSTVSLALTREIGRVFATLMVSSPAGSAIATEMASMRVIHPVDALTTTGVTFIPYGVVPRVLAGRLTVPISDLACRFG